LYRAFVLDNLRITWQRSCVATAPQRTIPPYQSVLKNARWFDGLICSDIYIPSCGPCVRFQMAGITNIGKRTPRHNNEQALRLARRQTDPNSTVCLLNAVPKTHVGQAETARRKTGAPGQQAQ
jgi:hypothetical protein